MTPAAQMYTLREYTKTPEEFDATLGKVSALGYPAVQLSAIGAWDQGLIDPVGIRALLDKHGLVCCATHRPLARLRDHTDEEIAAHRTLGCAYTAVGSIGGDYGLEADGYRRFIAETRELNSKLGAAGIRFGFHNHHIEFMHQEGSRKPRYDVLVDESDLQLEIDTYWVAVAGHDPAALLRRVPGRIAAVHLKDLEVTGWEAPTYAPVGEGNLDWDAILSACRDGGTEWLIVEQDQCRRDPFDSLASSLEFLKSLL